MDLRCHVRHQWGQKIDVRGQIYEVSAGGVCKDVSDEHAKILLTCAGWELADARAAANAAAMVEPASERTKLVSLGPAALMRMARDLGLSVLGKDAQKLADDILARRAELAENAAREERDRIAQEEQERMDIEAAAAAMREEAQRSRGYAIERTKREEAAADADGAREEDAPAAAQDGGEAAEKE